MSNVELLTPISPYFAAPTRVLFFPHAGGSHHACGEFLRLVTDIAETWALQAPGHGARLTEMPRAALGTLVDAIASSLGELETKPVVLVGHSFGALLAHELARRLVASNTILRLVVAAAAPSPCRHGRHPALAHLPGPRLATAVTARFGSLDGAQTSVPAFAIPALRADLAMWESYVAPTGAAKDVPLARWVAQNDIYDTEDIDAWTRHYLDPIPVRRFAGGHFFLRDRPHEAAATLRVLLCRTP